MILKGNLINYLNVYVILFSVPGDGGSQFKAKLNKTHTVASYCIKKTNYYYDLWLNLEQLVPFLIDCFVDNMRLVLLILAFK